jgi:16S rRNA processing protein RimM
VADKFVLVTPPPGLFEINAEDAGEAARSEKSGSAPDAAKNKSEAGDNA